MRIERIIVGVDFSDPSIAAALWTARHLGRGAELILAHSIAVPEPPGFLRGRYPSRDGIIETARIGAAARLRKLATAIGAERVRWEILTDDPAGRIERLADEVGADLIVIGKHGARSGLWRGLGTTAERVSRSTSVPVLLVEGNPETRPRRMLVAVDDDDVTEWVLAWAARLAEHFDATVTLIHVVSAAVLTHVLSMAAVTAGGGEVDESAIGDEFREDAERWLRRLVDTRPRLDRAQYITAAGNPAEAILAAAERVGADLIVLGSRRPGRLRRAVLGSTASEVLHRATRSVLVVKEPAHGPTAP